MKHSFIPFAFVAIMLVLLSACETGKKTDVTDAQSDEKEIDFFDHLKYILVPRENEAQAKEIDNLFRTSLGKTPSDVDLFENINFKKRIINLVGNSNFKLITDTCFNASYIEFRDIYFTFHGDILDAVDGEEYWLMYDSENDNMIVMIWRYPLLEIYWNEEDPLSSSYMLQILAEKEDLYENHDEGY